jgi:hypothetical protein
MDFPPLAASYCPLSQREINSGVPVRTWIDNDVFTLMFIQSNFAILTVDHPPSDDDMDTEPEEVD